eukprot:6184271-Pleurochrysis_carterae.AAC.1
MRSRNGTRPHTTRPHASACVSAQACVNANAIATPTAVASAPAQQVHASPDAHGRRRRRQSACAMHVLFASACVCERSCTRTRTFRDFHPGMAVTRTMFRESRASVQKRKRGRARACACECARVYACPCARACVRARVKTRSCVRVDVCA